MRFITEDTNKGDVKDSLSLNLYTYCQGNPVMYYDTNGHKPLIIKYGGQYHFSYTSKQEELIWAGAGSIPFASIGIFFGRRILGPLVGQELIEEDDFNGARSIFLDLASNSEYFTKSVSKDIAKSAGYLSILFTLKDINSILKTDDSIDIFISQHFDDSMRSNSKKELIAKYMYAQSKLKEFIGTGMITMDIKNGIAYYGDPNNFLDELEKQLYGMSN